jgi:hypothetical protein
MSYLIEYTYEAEVDFGKHQKAGNKKILVNSI